MTEKNQYVPPIERDNHCPRCGLAGISRGSDWSGITYRHRYFCITCRRGFYGEEVEYKGTGR